MIAGIQLKICGLTSVADAQAAAVIGADWLGFNFHPKSPRHVSLEHYRAMQPQLPAVKKVVVCVEPTPVDLAHYLELGCDAVQVHFKADEPLEHVTAWSVAVGPDRLWLAPRLPPAGDVRAGWLELADTFLLDTYHAEKFGGTGETGDWTKFRRHREAHPGRTWILAGGLTPANVAAAIASSGARFVDVNSGVESSPGVKDAARLAELQTALRDS